jgi:fibronectin type 3 domain-containing protein
MNSSTLSTTAYTDTSVSAGQTYYYVATDLSSAGEESAYSNQVTAAIP